MKIGAISDSHIPSRANKIPEKILRELDKTDRVVHAGDFETKETFKGLNRRYDSFNVARGNNDPHDLPASSTFNAGGCKVGVYHGAGITPRGDLDTLAQSAEKIDVDILVTGHTHRQRTVEHSGKLIINPGTCTGATGGSPSRKRPVTFSVIDVDTTVKVKEYKLKQENLEKQKKEFNI